MTLTSPSSCPNFSNVSPNVSPAADVGHDYPSALRRAPGKMTGDGFCNAAEIVPMKGIGTKGRKIGADLPGYVLGMLPEVPTKIEK